MPPPARPPASPAAQGSIGAVPATAGGESITDSEVLMRYTSAAGSWQIVPLGDSHGQQITFPWVASEVTPGGGVVLVGADNSGTEGLVTRNPGGSFAFSAPPASGPGKLDKDETLYPDSGEPTMAAIDVGGQVGALIAPNPESTSSPGVLGYQGGQWTRERICDPSSTGKNCGTWNSGARRSSPSRQAHRRTAGCSAHPLEETTPADPLLFERVTRSPGTSVWQPVRPSTWLLGAGSTPLPNEAAVPVGKRPGPDRQRPGRMGRFRARAGGQTR